MTTAAAKPVPAITEALEPFFRAAREGRLVVQRCTRCGARRLPPREICNHCLGRAMEWAQSSGQGTVVTFNVMHQVYHPGFADEVPYAVVLVALDDGGRIVSNVVDCPVEQVAIGLRVEVTFEDVGGAVVLPKFRPVAS